MRVKPPLLLRNSDISQNAATGQPSYYSVTVTQNTLTQFFIILRRQNVIIIIIIIIIIITRIITHVKCKNKGDTSNNRDD